MAGTAGTVGSVVGAGGGGGIAAGGGRGGVGGSSDAAGGAAGDGATGGGGAGGAADGGDTDSAGDASHSVDGVRVCGGGPGVRYCDLTVEADGFDDFEGMTVVVHAGPSTLRHAFGQTRVVGGKFSLSWPQGLDISEIYQQLAVLFDADGDGRCAPGEQYLRYSSLSCIGSNPTVFPIRPTGGPNPSTLRVADAAYCDGSFNLFNTCPADDGGAP